MTERAKPWVKISQRLKDCLRQHLQLKKLIAHINVLLLDLLISERKTIRFYTVDILVLIEMELKQTGARRNFGHVTLSTVMIK